MLLAVREWHSVCIGVLTERVGRGAAAEEASMTMENEEVLEAFKMLSLLEKHQQAILMH